MQAARHSTTRPALGIPRSTPAASLRGPDAVDVLAAVVGGKCIRLKGFRPQTAQRAPWGHPEVPFIAAPVSPMDLVPTLQRVERSRKWRLWIAAAATLLFFFALGIGTTWSLLASALARQSSPTASAQWSISSLDGRGVKVKAGTSTFFVPVGEQLPNGDVIVSVLPERSAVVLSSGTLLLRGPTGEASHGR